MRMDLTAAGPSHRPESRYDTWRTIEYFYSDPSLKQYTLQRC